MAESNPILGDEFEARLTVEVVTPANVPQIPANQDRRIPLVVGITGHRDLREQDRERLHEKVKGILVELKDRYPNTPLTVLSPMAEGADRIMAAATLELRSKYPNDVRLVAPLPISRESYAQDFDEASRAEFYAFLEAADYWFGLPLLKGNTPENIREPGAHRDRQYREVGKYIARHCQVLIALWNGLQTDLVGGTWQVVRFKTEGVEELGEFHVEGRSGADRSVLRRSLLGPLESGPVYHIVTPRSRHAGWQGEPLNLHRRYPTAFRTDNAARVYFAKVFQNIETFNKDAAAAACKLSEEMARSRNYIVPREVERELPLWLRAALERYSKADSLAMRFAGQMRSTQLRLHIWALLALMSFGLFAHLPVVQERWIGIMFPLVHMLGVDRVADILGLALQRTSVLLFSALLLYGLVIVTYHNTRDRNYQDKYQDYRALAEGLRVQFFWRLAGLSDSVADYYLGRHSTELDWIRNAIRNWNIPCGPCERVCRLDLVIEHWIRDQYRWFRKTKDEKAHRLLQRSTNLFLCLAGLGAGALFVSTLIWRGLQQENVHHGAAVLVISLLLILAGLSQHYADKMAFHEHAKQYRRMSSLFGHALDRIQHAEKPDQVQCLVRDLGIAALEENGDWVMLHRERPLEIPYGG